MKTKLKCKKRAGLPTVKINKYNMTKIDQKKVKNKPDERKNICMIFSNFCQKKKKKNSYLKIG